MGEGYKRGDRKLGDLVSVNATDGSLVVVTSGVGLTNPMITTGDLIYGGVGGTPQRLPKGTDGQVLTLSGGNPVWSSASDDDSLYLLKSTLSVDGDIFIRSGGNVTRLPIGSAGQVLTVSGGLLPAWAADPGGGGGGGGGGVVSPFYAVYTDVATADSGPIDPGVGTTFFVPDAADNHTTGLHCTVDAAYAGKTVLISFDIWWTTEHNLHVTLRDGTTVIAPGAIAAVAPDGYYNSKVSELVYVVPNDASAHTVHIEIDDSGSTGNVTFKRRSLEVKVLSGLAGGGSANVDTGVNFTSEISIPGLAGSPDIRVGGVNDDEFDQNTAGTPAGWTSFGTPDTVDTNSNKSHLHLKSASNGGGHSLKGVLKAATVPYTVTAKISDYWVAGPFSNFGLAGIAILDGSTTGKALLLNLEENSGFKVFGNQLSNWTTDAGHDSFVGFVRPQMVPFYMKIIVHAANNIDLLCSWGGKAYITLATGVNWLVSADHVALFVDPFSQQTEAYFDWIRFS